MLEIACWGIAILCSTIAMFLAALQPRSYALHGRRRRRRKPETAAPATAPVPATRQVA